MSIPSIMMTIIITIRITLNIIEIIKSMLKVIEEDCQWTACNIVEMHSNKNNNAFSKNPQKIGPPFDKLAFLPSLWLLWMFLLILMGFTVWIENIKTHYIYLNKKY